MFFAAFCISFSLLVIIQDVVLMGENASGPNVDSPLHRLSLIYVILAGNFSYHRLTVFDCIG